MRTISLLFLLLTTTFTGIASENVSFSNLPAIADDAIRVFLIRHGETYHNADPTISKDSEKYYQFTEKGFEQSKTIGQILKNQPIVQAYSSDTDRTWKTIAESGLLEDKSVDGKRDPAFNKVTVGKMGENNPGTFSWRLSLCENGIDPSPLDGESMAEAMQRVFDRIQQEQEVRGRAMIVVSHGDIIAGMAGTAVNVPPWECWERFRSNTGSISVLDVYENGAKCLWVFNANPLKE